MISLGLGFEYFPLPLHTATHAFVRETRKGWDQLLAAYLQEFNADDHVELHIVTKKFETKLLGRPQLIDFASQHLGLTSQQLAHAPTAYITQRFLDTNQYASVHRAADCFVLPTRGEGWGMPLSEAMSMAVPVIATNWSGCRDFIDDSVGYPISYTMHEVCRRTRSSLGRAGAHLFREPDMTVMFFIYSSSTQR